MLDRSGPTGSSIGGRALVLPESFRGNGAAEGKTAMSALQTMRHPVAERLRQNGQNYWRDCRVYILVLCLAAVADGASTVWFMRNEGVETEWNPIVRHAALVLGPLLGTIAGKTFQIFAGVVVTLYWRRWAPHLFLAASVIYVWAAWYNVWGRHIYTPILLQIAPW